MFFSQSFTRYVSKSAQLSIFPLNWDCLLLLLVDISQRDICTEGTPNPKEKQRYDLQDMDHNCVGGHQRRIESSDQ